MVSNLNFKKTSQLNLGPGLEKSPQLKIILKWAKVKTWLNLDNSKNYFNHILMITYQAYYIIHIQ